MRKCQIYRSKGFELINRTESAFDRYSLSLFFTLTLIMLAVTQTDNHNHKSNLCRLPGFHWAEIGAYILTQTLRTSRKPNENAIAIHVGIPNMSSASCTVLFSMSMLV